MPGRKGKKQKREEGAVELLLTAAVTEAVVSKDAVNAPASREEAGAAMGIVEHRAKKEQQTKEALQRIEQSKKAGEQASKQASERLEQSRQASKRPNGPSYADVLLGIPSEDQVLRDNAMTPLSQFWQCWRCCWLNNNKHGDHCNNCYQRR